jgi:glycosyltransferase involved in cell wall biosynthesis
MQPDVTIIIPVYNVEAYLEKCLQSVVEQTCKRIYVIAINDGSTDNSLAILNRYATIYSNFKVVSQENAGQSAARNKGIELAKSKYVFFLDADDYIETDTIEKLVTKMEKYDLDLIRFSAEPFIEEGVKYPFIRKQYDFKKYFAEDEVYEKAEFIQRSSKAFSASPCLFMVKRKILMSNSIRFPSGIVHEDELFTLQVFLHTNRAMYDPNPYYKRRFRAHSVMTGQKAISSKRSFDSYFSILQEMGKMLDKYAGELEMAFIKKRMGKLYGILVNSPLDKKYKSEKLNQITEMSFGEKLFYNLKYKPTKYAKIFSRLLFSLGS